MTTQTIDDGFEKVWKMFQELHRQFQNMQVFLKEKSEETDRRFKETDRQFRETDKYLKDKFEETDRQFKETDKRLEKKFKATDGKLNRLSNLFEGQWGKLIETLFEGDALRLFQERGLRVNEVHQRLKSRIAGDTMEVDLLLVNDTEMVAIEVKTTLKVGHVDEFLTKLTRFKEYFKHYRKLTLYGAVAGLRMEESADRHAYQSGLYVIKAQPSGFAEIMNDEKFVPGKW